MKQEDDPLNITESPYESVIKMEVVDIKTEDVYHYEQYTQSQTIQPTTRPCSAAERQRRYRERIKANEIQSCLSIGPFSDDQLTEEESESEIKKRRPQSSAERQKRYRERKKAAEIASRTSFTQLSDGQLVLNEPESKPRPRSAAERQRKCRSLLRQQQTQMEDSDTSHTSTDLKQKWPSDPELKERWIDCTKKEYRLATKYNYVCSRHYTDNCFNTQNENGRRSLLKLPVVSDELESRSVCAPSSQNEPISTPSGANTFDESLSQCYLSTNKFLCKRVLKLTNLLKFKNKKIKSLQENLRYHQKKVLDLQSKLKELEGKNVAKPEDTFNIVGYSIKEEHF